MAKRLQAKKAFITGGSRGIGAAIARRLASEGADVAFTYASNHDAARKVEADLRATGVRADAIQADGGDTASAREAIEQAAATLGSLDILVFNAGVADYVAIDAVDAATYLEHEQRHFSVNVAGVATMLKAALPHMADGGRIIMIGSVNAHQMPFKGAAIYGATKAALAALARGWARDLGERGILVNVIQPGPIDTDMNPDDDRQEVAIMTGMTALKRYGKPEEIAALASFLASEDASYITGATIDIDGGFSI